jgi:alpha-glucosidase (family GH31 glycosyl hydrolase)
MGILFEAKYGYSADTACADSCTVSNPYPYLYADAYTNACTDTYTRSDAGLSTSRSALGGIGGRG